MTTKKQTPLTSELPHPMQPIGWDGHGVIRYKRNAIVDFLVDACGNGYYFDLNDLAIQMQGGRRDWPVIPDKWGRAGATFTVPKTPFSQEDYTQLMQLTGYSVSGAGDLDQFSEDAKDAADTAAAALVKKSER